jgi:hypothetical protein
MLKRLIALSVCFTFCLSTYQPLFAQEFNVRSLPIPGNRINPSKIFMPLTFKGLVIHPKNALKFDFLMDTGHSALQGQDLKEEALKMMKYFLTALTMPEDDLWGEFIAL